MGLGALKTEKGSVDVDVVLGWKGSENVEGKADDVVGWDDVKLVKLPNGSSFDDDDDDDEFEDDDDVKSPTGSLAVAVDFAAGGTGFSDLSPGGGANNPFLSPGGGAKSPPLLFVLIFFSFFCPSPIWIFIFSPSFKLKSLNGAIAWTSPDAAALSLSTSCLKSANATLKSNASFLSLNAIPIYAFWPVAFWILSIKYLPLSSVLSTAVSSVTGHWANILFSLSNNVITHKFPFALILILPY